MFDNPMMCIITEGNLIPTSCAICLGRTGSSCVKNASRISFFVDVNSILTTVSVFVELANQLYWSLFLMFANKQSFSTKNNTLSVLVG